MTNREYALLAGKTLSAKKHRISSSSTFKERHPLRTFRHLFRYIRTTDQYIGDDVEEAFAKEGLLVKSVGGQNRTPAGFYWILAISSSICLPRK